MKLSDHYVVLGFRICWATFGFLPTKIRHALAKVVANLTYSRNGLGVQRLTFNIARVKGLPATEPIVKNISKRAMQSYMRYWVDMFAMTRETDERILRKVDVLNDAEFKAVFSQNRGAVLAVTHSGNWDLAGAYIAITYGGISTVAERLRPVELFDEFTKHRMSRNIEILPHRGGDVPPSVALDARLKAGRLVGLVSDRDMSHHGIEVPFFNHIAKMPIGAAKLAIENSVPLIPAAVYERDGRTTIEFYPQIDLSSKDPNEVTKTLAKTFEQIVGSHPENWHMLQKIWIDMPRELERYS